MIQQAIVQFMRSSRCDAVHLPFRFTPAVGDARQGSFSKIIELFRVISRLIRIRLAGPIDLLLYPTGGPQRVAMIRDILLLPWIFLFSRRVVLHFHAAGIADELEASPRSSVVRLLRFLYGKAFAAVVMTDFNRRDPEAAGISRILVVPHRIVDDLDPALVLRGQSPIRFLYVGHLCADKGTPQLLAAFAALRKKHPEIMLDLMGECLPPFEQQELERFLDQLQLRVHVQLLGVLTGPAKAEAFGRADLFVFPTVAPYESFGLALAEAMAWKLPIVASKWRGNSDVLTPGAGAISFSVSSSLEQDIETALEQALQKRAKWEEWGEINRSIFQERYRENEAEEWLVAPLLSLLKDVAPGPQRILYVHNSADLYGASRSLIRLLQSLDRSRFQATVILPEDGPLKTAIENLGVRVLVDSSLAIVSRYSSWIMVIGYRFPISVRRLCKFIRKENIDLVHTNTGVILGPGLAAKMTGIPHIWHMRESFRATRPRLWEIYSVYIRMVSDKILAVSNAVAAQFSDRRKVVVIHNGFSLDEFAVSSGAGGEFRQRLGIAEKDLVVGCVGRIKWARKGQEHLIQAASLLKARGLALKYLIVGSPYPGNEIHLERLKNLVRDLNLQDEIIFAGELSDPKPAYAMMDIVVLPSAQPEPFGGVVMEAMAIGLPVIATNIGGSLDQVAEGVTGFLVPPADPSALAEKIELLANDPELRRRMGAAGRERIAKNFSLTEMVKKIETLYDDSFRNKRFS
jgi:glycosyltransferase involved in cell wall biosynthesis